MSRAEALVCALAAGLALPAASHAQTLISTGSSAGVIMYPGASAPWWFDPTSGSLAIKANGSAVSTFTATGALQLGSPLGINYGGTGQNWSAVAAGAVPYFSGAGTLSTLGIGSANTYFRSNGVTPTWNTIQTGDLPTVGAPYLLNTGDKSTGDLQIGVSSASTYSASGYMTFANLTAAPAAAIGRIYYNSALGEVMISTNGTTFQAISPGLGGTLTSVVSNASQFSGQGTSGSPLTLLASSVTLQGNIFNGAGQLVQLNPSGDLQVGTVNASTYSGSGYMTLAGLASAPPPAMGRLYFDTGFGGLKISTNGVSYVALSTVTGALVTINANAFQFSGNGTAGSPLALQVSSVTLQGNAFNGPSQLVQLLSNGLLPALNGSNLTNVAGTDPTKLPLAGGTLTGQLTLAGSTETITGNAFSVGGSTFVVNAGRVGIGSASPQGALDVETGGIILGTTGNTMQLSTTGNGGVITPLSGGASLFLGSNAGGRLEFDVAGTEKARVDSTGNVGIGTSAPATTLDVGAAAQFGTAPTKSTFTAAGVLQLASALGPAYGGTGQNWSGVAQGNIPYFSGTGVLTTLAPGTGGWLLSTNGAGANPSWFNPASLSVGTATNLAGGAANEVPYQSGSGATAFTAQPSGANQVLFYNGTSPAWSPSPTLATSLTVNGIINANAATGYQEQGIQILQSSATNIFAGVNAGFVNTGANQTFVGVQAGVNNTTGANNTFVGYSAGSSNTAAQGTFLGALAGASNSTGSNNVIIGFEAAYGGGGGAWVNTTGSNNTFIGTYAGPTANNLSNATAIGYNASVAASNALVLGSGANVGIGSTAPGALLEVLSGPAPTWHGGSFAQRVANDSGGSAILGQVNAVNVWGAVLNNQASGAEADLAGGPATTPYAAIFTGGRVGIGNSAPFDLLSNTNANVTDAAGTGTTGGSGMTWSGSGAGYLQGLSQTSTLGNADGLLVRIATTSSGSRILTLDSNAVDRLVVTGGGWVGISTSSPGFPFDIETANLGGYSFAVNNNEGASAAGGAAGAALFQGTGSSAGAGLGLGLGAIGTSNGSSGQAYGIETSGTAGPSGVAFGVNASASAGSGGTAYGVNGSASSASTQYGVYGSVNNGTTIYGVYGSANTSAAGQTGYGLYGTASGAGANWGLYVSSGSSYFAQNVGIGSSAPIAKLNVVAASNAQYGTYSQIPATTNVGTSFTSTSTYNGLSGLVPASLRANYAAAYQFGVVGEKQENNLGAYYYDQNSGGVLGVLNDETQAPPNNIVTWGALGYLDSNFLFWAGYFHGNVYASGSVQVGSATTGCTSATYGSLQWTGSQLQLCNSNGWTDLQALPTQCYTYTVINDATRNITAGTGSSCDTALSTGWYRFTNSGNSTVPTSAPAQNECSTNATGWFSSVGSTNNGTCAAAAINGVSGTMPALGATSSGYICYNWSTSTCYWSSSAQVTNCGGFYVYYITPIPSCCSLRTCTTGP